MKIKLSKKQVLVICLIVILILAGILIYFLFFRTAKKTPESGTTTEGIIQKQLDELQALPPSPLSEEDIQQQLQELGKQAPVLSEEEINKQLQDLNR